MHYYYSASTNGFYVAAVHGAPTLEIIDPEFEWPMIEVPDPDYQGEEEAPMIQVRAESIDPPMIQVPNPETKMPADVVEVTADEHQRIISGENETWERAPGENGYPTLIERPPLSIEELAAQKRSELDTARDTAFAAGLPYDINGEQDIVQTRPQDQINLLGLNAKATRLITTGNADVLMEFRGGSNVSHWINAEAMDNLTMAALSHIEEIYQQSWERKDALDAALKAEDREAIEALSW